VVCLAPRAPGDSVRPRRLSGVVVRPLNFTVRRRMRNHILNAGSCVVVSVLTFMAWAFSSAPWAHFSSSWNCVAVWAARDFIIPLLGAFVLVLLIKGKGALLWAITLSVPFFMVRLPFTKFWSWWDYLALLGALAGGLLGQWVRSRKHSLAAPNNRWRDP